MAVTDHKANIGSHDNNINTHVNVAQEGLSPTDLVSLKGVIGTALTNQAIPLENPTESEAVKIVAIADGALLGYARTPQEFIKLLADHQTVPDYFCADCHTAMWDAWVEMAWAAIEQRSKGDKAIASTPVEVLLAGDDRYLATVETVEEFVDLLLRHRLTPDDVWSKCDPELWSVWCDMSYRSVELAGYSSNSYGYGYGDRGVAV